MASRPLVGVHGKDGKTTTQTRLPAVFTSPIRNDVVQAVHTNMAKNKRQPYAVSRHAGEQTSAESWGTGRAVARIPRVPGGGTHRAGQGAFGNMCRGGRMFAPTRVWRRWHRRTNKNQKRFAVCSALAATAHPSLVLARGHRVEKVSEIPLVITDVSAADLEKPKTKDAVSLLKALRAYEDVNKVKETVKTRAGKGKMRNRRRVKRKGPLIVYNKKNQYLKAFRNLPGIELSAVDSLDLLQLAPGGHLGRFVIWFKDAFDRLDSIFGTQKYLSKTKGGFKIPRALMSNPDLSRIINSDEIQSRLRPVIKQRTFHIRKKNPLKNFGALVKLNPYALAQRRRQLRSELARKEKKQEVIQKKRKEERKKASTRAAKRKDYYTALHSNPLLYEIPKKKEAKEAPAQEGAAAAEEEEN
jgi:large subunit ribosomal protein L4e